VPHQDSLTLVAEVRDGAQAALDAALAAAAATPATDAAIPFDRLTGVHFARLISLPGGAAADGSQMTPKVVWMSDVDAPLERHVRELSEVAGPALDRILVHCEGYPESADPPARLAWLRAHTIRAAAVYVNTVGRGVEQVVLERRLRDALEGFLDEHRGELVGRDPHEVRAEIQRFVAGDETLRPALEPAPPLELGFRIRECAHAVLVPAALLALAPVYLPWAPLYALVLRLHELRDEPEHEVPDDAHVEALAALEDLYEQNPFTASGPLKKGLFRRYTATTILWIASYAVRHVFNDGNLAGVKTIHFARWVFLDDKRRVVFASNYDGSVESYMDDFIDKVAWGLNGVFSNGLGYPRTSWLVRGGARDEQAFKNFLRRHQSQTQVWYSAYPDLTARNLQNNARIRAGLSGALTRDEVAAWLQRL
jgi:hypothetical protein